MILLRTRLPDLGDPQGEGAQGHLDQILAACLAHEGGAAALWDSLTDMPHEGRSEDAVALIATVTVRDLLPPGHVDLLRRRFSDMPNIEVSDVWAEVWHGVADSGLDTVPGAGLAEPGIPASVLAAIDELADRPGDVRGVTALLNLVSTIATRLPPGAKARLYTWLEGANGQFTWSGVLPLTELNKPDTNGLNTTFKAGLAMSDQAMPTSDVGTEAPLTARSGGEPVRGPRGVVDPVRLIGPAVWNAPQRNVNFTGREELLAKLHLQLSRSDLAAVLPQALHGLGGVGKTQLAIEYVYLHQHEYDVIWWIPSEQPQQILSALAELAQHLNLNVGMEANTAVPAVKEALRKGEPYGNWLLVFDNAEDAETVLRNIPTGGSGKVLVTSRNSEWTLKAQSLEVDVFERDESIKLLRRRDKDISEGNANRLAEALGDLPLAIEQAAAWRAATGMAVEEYIGLLEAKVPELLAITATSGYEPTVAAVWTVSLDRLEKINPAAMQLLQVAAYFAPEPIARSLFGSPRQQITAALDEVLRDPIKLGRALRDIQRFALARVDHRTDTVQLHRLVQAVLIARIPAEAQETFRHGAHGLLAAANPRSPFDVRNWDRYAALLSHVKVSDAVRCQEPWVRDLVFDLVKYLYHWGDHQGCQDLAQTVYETWRELLGEDNAETLRIAKFLGYILWVNGEFAGAQRIRQETLVHYERSVAPDDEDLLDARMMVAQDLRAVGDADASLQLSREVLDVCIARFGEDDPLTLRAAHELGCGLRLAGCFQEALDLDSETARLRRIHLGDSSAETLSTTNGYTIDLREAGDYVRARDEQEVLYARYVALMGDRNPATVRAGRNLAVARRRAGDHEGALEMSRIVERRFRRRYGRGSADAMAAALNLAVDLRQNHDLAGAIERGLEVVDEYRKSLGETHPFTLAAHTNLAVALRLSDRLQDALEHDEAAFRGLRQTLGPRHPSTLTAAINLASDRYGLEDYPGAFDLDSETLEFAREVLGGDHPTTLACNANLALDLRALGRVSEANTVHADVVARFHVTLGDKHPATLSASRNARADCDLDPMPL